MEEVFNLTEEDKKEAYAKVEGFEFNDLCFKSIFEILNNSGAFVQAFKELTTYAINDKEHIKLTSFNYGFILENDGKIYPTVDLIILVRDSVSGFQTNFCLTLTPFNAKLDDFSKKSGVYGGCDKQFTRLWRLILMELFKDKWVEAFMSYCAEVKNIRESEITTDAEIKYLKNEQQYEEEINSI